MEFPATASDACAAEIRRVLLHRGEPAPTAEKIKESCAAYAHAPTTRSWGAVEIRQVTAFLREVGFHPADPLELNELLDGVAVAGAVEEANVFLWPRCAQELCIGPDRVLADLEALEVDTQKWSRRAPATDGVQTKRARHNCCFTDLGEEVHDPDEGDVTALRVRHKHPKNPAIKYTNYSFAAVRSLAAFRERLARVLGPFGYKVRGQFAELNKYFDVGPDALTKARASGIGRHGDTERGGARGPGSVNCLKIGAHLPILFAWYQETTPIGHAAGPDAGDIDVRNRATPMVAHKDVAVASAVVALGHGDFYSFSRKAVGADWKKRKIATLRHCAGGRKYTGLPPAYYENLVEAYGKHKVAYSLTFSDCVENDSESPELQFSTPYAALR